MIVHMRKPHGDIVCMPAGARVAVISSSQRQRVTCSDCLRRMFGEGGDGVSVATAKPDDYRRIAVGFARS